MGAIQQIFCRFGTEYLARFGEQMPAQHHKVIEAISQCRTEAYGSILCESRGLRPSAPPPGRLRQSPLSPVPATQVPAVA